MKNLIGKRLDDRYEFVELIGIGGMANVYKAYDSLKGCYVAIKVLKEKYLGNEEFVYRFRNESKANASLSHPNIVRIFDVGFGNKMQYIVMEYIEGVTLKEFINKAKVLNWKDVVHFTFQILRGLQHAHDKGIVHRDIKPQNIMLLEDGTIKIMDFGIARFPRDEKIDFKKTVGSVHYISPEQAIGGITDFKSDIYSVGIMMYEMLTGQLPFDGRTPEIVAQKQIKDNVRSPLEINPNLPQGLVDIILRAIKKKPQDRYQSTEEMLRDIDEFKQNPNVSFGYRYLDDIDTTKYFGLSRNIEPIEESTMGYKKNKIKTKKKEKLVPILIGVAGGFFLLAIVMVITFMFRRGRNDLVDIEIPNFVGHNVEEVKIMDNGKYKDLGITIINEPSSKHSPGTVIQQSIKPGTCVKSNNGSLVLTVASSVEKKRIPNVIGMDVEEAEEKLKKIGFVNIKKIEAVDEQKPKGSVIKITPNHFKDADGVALDTNIRLYYNTFEKDENILDVPNVVGKSLEEAKELIKSCGFQISVKTVCDKSKISGVVISQNKSKAPLDSVIEIVYNLHNYENQEASEFWNSGEKSNSKSFKESNLKSSYSSNKIDNASVVIASSTKMEDPFHVFVLNGKEVVAECQYDTAKQHEIKFKADFSKNTRYTVMIKNDKTDKEAKYGTVEVYTDSQGQKHCKSNCSPHAFYKTISF